MDQPTRYQPEIDGLRAIAITPVVLFHAGVPGLRGGYVAPIPLFRMPLPECLAHGSAAQCGASRASFERGEAPLLAALRDAVKGYENVRIWNPSDLLCDAAACTPMRDGTIMYSDRGHLSVLGAQALALYAAPQLDWLRGP